MKAIDFKKELGNLETNLKSAKLNNVSLAKAIDEGKELVDYGESKKGYYRKALLNSLKSVKSKSIFLNELIAYDLDNQPKVNEILELIPELESSDMNQLEKTAKKIIFLAKQLNFPKEKEMPFKMPRNIPDDIRQDAAADINELGKCFDSGCYRSSIVLCGRLLEAALHRKYFDVTGEDLLEKAPGMGLGKILAKLTEKKVYFDPGLTQQIHLVNQVRVFSVHRKKEAFNPSKEQTYAIILYTLDVLGKIFS